MAKIIDTRSAAKKAKDARFRAEPIARVIKPLRFINETTGRVGYDKVTGRPVWVESDVYQIAKRANSIGHGAAIQRIALSVA